MFICLTGEIPWKFSSACDASYRFFMLNGIRSLLRSYNRECLVTDAAVDLLDNIFISEVDRISVDDALIHPFITGLVIDPSYDFDTCFRKSDVEEVVDGKLFDLQYQDTVLDTYDYGISVTEEQYNDGLSDIFTSDSSCDFSNEDVIYGEEVNNMVTAAVIDSVQDPWDSFVIWNSEVSDCDDRIISQSEQKQVEDLSHITLDFSPKSDIIDDHDDATRIDPVHDIDLPLSHSEKVLNGELFTLGDQEMVADSSDVLESSSTEKKNAMIDVLKSESTLHSSSEYSIKAEEVEDMVTASLYSNKSSIMESGTKRNSFLIYNRSKRKTLARKRGAREIVF